MIDMGNDREIADVSSVVSKHSAKSIRNFRQNCIKELYYIYIKFEF